MRLDGGKTLEVNVPAGIDDGQQIRLRGQGDDGHGGRRPATRLSPSRSNRIPVSGARARHSLHLAGQPSRSGARCADRRTHRLGACSLTIPAGANSGTRLRLKGRGIAVEGGAPGDQYVTLEIVLPEATDEALRDFAATWTAGAKHNPRKDFSDS